MVITSNLSKWLPEGEKFDSVLSEEVELVEKLLSIGTALSSSYDLEELLNLILTKSREITWSDAGSIYLVNKSDSVPKLLFKAAQNDSLPSFSFQEFVVPLTLNSLAGYAALTGKSLNIADAYNLSPNLPYQLDRRFDNDFSYRTRSVLVLPMQDQEGEVIGVLQLINRKLEPSTKITPENALVVTQPYSKREEKVLRSLASQTAISIERNLLQNSIENLFEGFVRASVQVIEARDPTTSGHSERVAELTVRLAQETNSVNTGWLGSIEFSDRQIQEIRYAALLHDFGKVNVPEKILNKRKKLYPEQLEVIRQRFTTAQRTLEMECAQKKFQYLTTQLTHHSHDSSATSSCSHCQQFEQLDLELAQAISQLSRYLELIEEFNEPKAVRTKSQSEELLLELKALSQYNYKDINCQPQALVTPVEIEQLMLSQGNLTLPERQAIEAHVSHTYEFLKRIPWTKHLQNVPLIAYCHHEKLDGSGYPLNLRGEDIPIQTQIMTVADIYDALTAADRPYKRPLPVSTALRILSEEAANNKINPDLVELFEQRQVYTVLGHSL